MYARKRTYRVAMCCSVLQCVALLVCNQKRPTSTTEVCAQEDLLCGNVFQCVVVCCIVGVLTKQTQDQQVQQMYTCERIDLYCNVLQCFAIHCSLGTHTKETNKFNRRTRERTCVLVCFSVWQCVAVLVYTPKKKRLGDHHVDTATYCNTLQHTTTHCNTLRHTKDSETIVQTLQHAATHCNTLQHTATHCNTLQHTATHRDTQTTRRPSRRHCNTLQHTATHCNTFRHTKYSETSHRHCNTLQHTATHCNTLQHTAAHCNTLRHTKDSETTKYNRCTCARGLISVAVCCSVL